MRRKIAERRKSSGWPAWLPRWPALLSTLPVATIILTLIGYGYDLAYLEAFGLSPQMLEHGPLDFLLRATYGLLPLIETSTHLKEQLSTTEGLHRIWRDTEWMRYIGTAAALTLLSLAFLSKELASTAPFRSHVFACAMGRARAFIAKAAHTYKSISKAWRLVFGFGVAGWLTPPVFAYLLGAVLWIVGTLVLFSLTAAPFVGITAGRTHAYELVVAPVHCARKSSVGQRTRDGATCVRVLKDGKELASGRLIDQTNNRVWLLRKRPWVVTSVPLDGAVVEYTAEESPS